MNALRRVGVSRIYARSLRVRANTAGRQPYDRDWPWVTFSTTALRAQQVSPLNSVFSRILYRKDGSKRSKLVGLTLALLFALPLYASHLVSETGESLAFLRILSHVQRASYAHRSLDTEDYRALVEYHIQLMRMLIISAEGFDHGKADLGERYLGLMALVRAGGKKGGKEEKARSMMVGMYNDVGRMLSGLEVPTPMPTVNLDSNSMQDVDYDAFEKMTVKMAKEVAMRLAEGWNEMFELLHEKEEDGDRGSGSNSSPLVITGGDDGYEVLS